MRTSFAAAVAACLALSAVVSVSAQNTPQRAQPIKAGEVPGKKVVAPLPPRGTFVPPRTPWGDPDIAGDYNNSDESGIPFERPSDDRINTFAKILADRGLMVSVRKSRGRDIRAACGQLIVEGQSTRKSAAQKLAAEL